MKKLMFRGQEAVLFEGSEVPVINGLHIYGIRGHQTEYMPLSIEQAVVSNQWGIIATPTPLIMDKQTDDHFGCTSTDLKLDEVMEFMGFKETTLN